MVFKLCISYSCRWWLFRRFPNSQGLAVCTSHSGNLPVHTAMCTCVLGPSGVFPVVDCLGQRAHTFQDLICMARSTSRRRCWLSVHHKRLKSLLVWELKLVLFSMSLTTSEVEHLCVLVDHFPWELPVHAMSPAFFFLFICPFIQ